ncbi:MAG: hypothetical protein KGO02_06950 [Alphaproteobacteria bacterium]|nr:hypothetical protein [Alphaproteobacteria bacterium]
MITNQEDVAAIARWAVITFGSEAGTVIRRRAAENLLADEREAAALWCQVADIADHYLGQASVH